MLSKEEIETCKEELSNYIEFMESAGDNAGWARGLRWHIDQLESDKQKLIEKLEKTIDFVKTSKDSISKAKIEVLENVLKILKGENDE